MCNPAKKRAYQRRAYRLEAGFEDELVADLWEVGTLGVQTLPADGPVDEKGNRPEKIRLEAWFPAENDGKGARDGNRQSLQELESRWRRRGVEILGTDSVPEEDWLALWRRGARPIPVGERLLLDPREPKRAGSEPEQVADASGRFLLRLPARRAFGTGSHESTRLVLRLLEEACFGPGGPPERVLDVGTGTGVLAFAARRFGVPRVVAYDVDSLAVCMAWENARLNGFGAASSPRFFAGPAAALAPLRERPDASSPDVRQFDLLLVNILPHLVEKDLPALVTHVAAGGTLVVGGLLADERSSVLGRLETLGFVLQREVHEGAWIACRCRRREDRESAWEAP